jgi:hypothetical protein
MSLNILIINRATNICSGNADFVMNTLASPSTTVNINAGFHTSSNLLGFTFALYSFKPG